MEFDILPRAKFYSPKSNISTTNNQTVNININDKVDKVDEIKTTETNPTESNPTEQKHNELKPIEPARTIEFLKLLLEAHLSNPIKFNGLVICSSERLQELIKVLVNCDEVKIDTNDIDVSCCGKTVENHFVPIAKIWCRTNDISEVFKYKYSQYLEIFEAYKISLKYVYCE